MTTIVVGGHARKVGKTSIAAGLIAAFPQCPWTAIKISSHWHGDSSTPDLWDIYEESARSGRSDTSRFLAAGASRSLWVRVKEHGYDAAMQRLMHILQSSPFLIIESNRVLEYINPDLFIFAARFDAAEFKDSARNILGRADAIVAVNDGSSSPPWKETDFSLPEAIPVFTTEDPKSIPAGLLELVKSRLFIHT